MMLNGEAMLALLEKPFYAHLARHTNIGAGQTATGNQPSISRRCAYRLSQG
jgi:hypothetical protein